MPRRVKPRQGITGKLIVSRPERISRDFQTCRDQGGNLRHNRARASRSQHRQEEKAIEKKLIQLQLTNKKNEIAAKENYEKEKEKESARDEKEIKPNPTMGPVTNSSVPEENIFNGPLVSMTSSVTSRESAATDNGEMESEDSRHETSA